MTGMEGTRAKASMEDFEDLVDMEARGTEVLVDLEGTEGTKTKVTLEGLVDLVDMVDMEAEDA